MDGFWSEAASIVVMVGGIAIIRIFLGSIKNDLEKELKHMTGHCKTVHCSVEKGLRALQREDQALWNALNTHGHKGLEGNGAKVTR